MTVNGVLQLEPTIRSVTTLSVSEPYSKPAGPVIVPWSISSRQKSNTKIEVPDVMSRTDPLSSLVMGSYRQLGDS